MASCCPPRPGERSLADLQQISAVLAALADPHRLWLVCNLAGRGGPATLTQASSCCGVHLSGVSRHLGKLRAVGIVEAHKQGREVLHRLKRAELAQTLRDLADWLDAGAPCAEAQPADHNP